jgi:hypothetical protein
MSNAIAIRDLDDVERLARLAVTSGLTQLRKPEEAAVILMTGHELGLSPMQSLRGIYVVSGRPVLSADLMVAVVRRSGLCESWRVVESTSDRCEIWTLRRGEDAVAKRVWTMADAKRAGITGKGTWAAYPAAMLRHRCAADLAREVYPDVLMGLYDPEELTAEDVREDHIAAARSEVSRRVAAGQSIESIESQLRDVIGRPQLPAPASWADDLAACSDLRGVRSCYAAHRTAETDGAAMVADVRAWLRGRGLVASGAEVTAVLSTLPMALLDALDLATLVPDGEREVRPDADALVAAAVAVRGAGADEHSTRTAWSILARSYAEAQGTSVRDAAAALKAACESPDEPPPTGTDGPRAPQGDAADAAGSAVASSNAAAGERAELRVVRVESDDPCVTSAEAWAAHIAAKSNPHEVRGSFRKRAPAFEAEGVWPQRSVATMERLRALGITAPNAYLTAPVAIPTGPKPRRPPQRWQGERRSA